MIDQLGRYRIVSKIGEGGMGVVYRARDEVLQRDVAIKVVSQRSTGDTSARDSLLHEARASSALSHPNICTVHEVGEIDGEMYIVMEFVEGKSLSPLAASGGLPVESVLRYGVQIAAALAHSHSRSIVHRDLKSSNVMVTPEGLVKVLDFGLARRLFKDAPAEATRTIGPLDSDARIVGTLPYMAPEVLRGAPGDYRSDIWALGVVLYEAAAGQLPFSGRTTFEITSAITHELAPPLPLRIPRGLWAIIQRSLAKEPEQRYQRASEVQAALEAVHSAAMTGPERPIDPKGFSTTVLRSIRHVAVKNGDVLLMVGTMKGAFLLRSTAERARWDVGGPYFHGQAVYAMAYDGRNGRHRLWASTQSGIWGTILRSSDDFGKTWTNPMEATLKFPADSGASLKNIWQICLGRPEEPDVMYCGVEPRCSNRRMPERPGRWFAAYSIIRIAPAGCPDSAGSPCIPYCQIRRTASGCTWRFRPAAFMLPTMAASPGGLPTAGSGWCTCRKSTPSSDNAYTRSPCTRRAPNASFCKTTGACTALTMPPKAGTTSLTGCPPTLVMPL